MAKDLQQLSDEAWNAYWGDEDYEKAFSMFAELNMRDPEKGNYMLGMCFEFGDGVERNIDRAIEYYRKGMGLGSQFCKEHLLSITGDGVNRRHTQSWMRDYEISVRCDEGAEYLMDDAVEFDHAKGTAILKECAMAGSAFACDLLGYAFRFPAHGVAPDYEQGKIWAIFGAQGGYTNCALQVANHYYAGEGMEEPDVVECAYWYRKAALMGSAKAMQTMGTFYFEGAILTQNYAKAEIWYKLALRAKDLGEDLSYDDREAINQNLREIEAANKKLDAKQKLYRENTMFDIKFRYDDYQKWEGDEWKKAQSADEAESNGAGSINTARYNAVLVKPDGAVQKIYVDLMSSSERASAVDAVTTDKLLTAQLSEYGKKYVGTDICGFCDGNGYTSGKPENMKIMYISGYDVIIGDVVLCGCQKYDYYPLTGEQTERLYRALGGK